jgi:hypothetical protein
VIDRTGWQAAFLAGHAPSAVEALQRGWQDLLARGTSLSPTMKEPALTELLCLYLQSQSERDKLTGLWGYENLQGDVTFGPKGEAKVTKRKRTDIRYFSNLESPALNLIFEFKKLSHGKSTRDKYAGEEGMLRFVTGEYSKRQPLALMVGILTMHPDDCIPPLTRFLNSADAKSLLLMETVAGKQTRAPSSFFAHAHFDTEHVRPADRAPAHGTIVISHLFVDFPDLPRAVAKQSRRRRLVAELDA